MSGIKDFSNVLSTVDLSDKILAVKSDGTSGNVSVEQIRGSVLSSKGQPNGLAELDESGKIPSAQLPSYVDDVVEYSSISVFPAEGVSGKVYVAVDTNKVYRWTGTTYVEISQSVQLGESEWTAYRGDRGKIAYDHSQRTGNPHNLTKRDIGLSNVDNTSDLNKPLSVVASSKFDEVEEKIDTMASTKFDGGYVENGVLYLTADGNVMLEVTGIGGGGGGGGSANNAKLTVTKISDYFSKTITEGTPIQLKFNWSSLEDGNPTGQGGMVVRNNGTVVASKNIEQGDVVVELGDYLNVGSNAIKVTVSDVYDNERNISVSINVASLTIKSFFDDTEVFSTPIKFSYTAMGNYSKQVHFIVDGEEVGSEVTNSITQQTFTFPLLSHGDHDIEVFYTTILEGSEVSSNHLKYNVICLEEGNTTPVISAIADTTNVKQFDNLSIRYKVYTPNELYSSLTLSDGSKTTSLPRVDREPKLWTYIVETSGEHTLTMTCGATQKTFVFEAEESSIDVEATTDYQQLYLTSYGRSNSEENPAVWTYNDVEASLDNFNFISDGWLNDEDGVVALKVTGDARVSIPFNVFGENFIRDGKTIEIEFSTSEVRDYDTTVISCWSDDRGFKVSPQFVTLKSEGAEITTQYKEDEHIRVAFTVEKTYEDRVILCYINGVCSGAIQYPEMDDFSQPNPVGISIGSNDATTNIYNIRVYGTNLSRRQVLNNWIADTQIGSLKANRYNRNNIYDEYDNVVVGQLPSDIPYFVLDAQELPQFKGDVKTVEGRYVDPLNPTKSFTFAKAEIDVQGTSSQYYARKNYKIKFKDGITVNGSKQSKYALSNNSIPVSTFCLKADVASSEGANNVQLVRLYNDIAPKTPPQLEDNKVRQGIEGYPIVVFQSINGQLVFLGKYNFNNDKSTSDVFGFVNGNESWEFKNNVSDRVNFISAYFVGDAWKEDFEARYPDIKPMYANTSKLSEMIAWVASTNTDGLEGAEREAKLQKFRDEVEQYFNKDALIFNYLFSEFFLMVDNRAKNIFPSLYSDGKWYIIPYDYDTAIGTDNVGALKFDYHYETGDVVDGTDTPVFAGSKSVLYNNVREAFEDDITEMYMSLRNAQNGVFNYETIEKRFEEHQSKWPEAIFNEDAWYKYLQPLADDNDNSYISMLQGSKSEQRKWWLYNRFKYMDSKFVAGDSSTDVITLRCYNPSNLELTPYADIYATVFFEGTKVQERARRGEVCEITNPMTAMNNTPVYIYSSSQLKDVGDLSSLKIGYANFTYAPRLERLIVGSGESGYTNTNLSELYVGNNPLLSYIDVRNCSGLTQNVDLSGCSNIEEAYFDGTSVVGVSLPNGGMLKKLHLPDTVTNLTLRNQKVLEEFVLNNPSNVSTLWLEDNSDVVNVLDLLTRVKDTARVRVYGFEKDVDSEQDIADFLDSVSTMRGLESDSAELSGVFNIPTITYENWVRGNQNPDYPYLRINAESIICSVVFKGEDGTVLYSGTTGDGNIVFPYNNPTKASTVQYTYTFDGWMDEQGNEVSLSNIRKSYTLFPKFRQELRLYTVRFINNSTGSNVVLETKSVGYGNSVAYTGETPTYNGSAPEDWGEFIGWTPNGFVVTGDVDYIAQFRSLTSITRKYLSNTETYNMSITSNVTSLRSGFTIDRLKAKELRLPNVSMTNSNIINENGGAMPIQYLYLPKVTSISTWLGSNIRTPLAVYLGTDIDSICVLGNKNYAEYVTTFFVPDSLVDTYKSAPNWSNWASKIKGVSESLSITDYGFNLGGTFDLSDGTNVTAYYRSGMITSSMANTSLSTFSGLFDNSSLPTGLDKTNYLLEYNGDSRIKDAIDNGGCVKTIRALRETMNNNEVYIPSSNEALEYLNSSVNKPTSGDYWTSSIVNKNTVYGISASSKGLLSYGITSNVGMLVFVKNN